MARVTRVWSTEKRALCSLFYTCAVLLSFDRHNGNICNLASANMFLCCCCHRLGRHAKDRVYPHALFSPLIAEIREMAFNLGRRCKSLSGARGAAGLKVGLEGSLAKKLHPDWCDCGKHWWVATRPLVCAWLIPRPLLVAGLSIN